MVTFLQALLLFLSNKFKEMKQLLYLFLAFAITSCNSGNKETAKHEITILGENAATIQAMMSLEKDFEKKYPEDDLVFKPNSYDDAFTKANQDFANGTGLYDIVMQYNFSLSSFVRNNYIYDMAPLLKNIPDSLKTFERDIFPNAWKEVGFYADESKKDTSMIKVGYPWASNSMLLMYNKTMFEDADNKARYKEKYNHELTVPDDWESFVRVSDFFTNKSKNKYGVCLQGADGGWVYFEWMNFLFGLGGKTMDKQFGWQGDANTKLLLNSPEALHAAELYKSLKPFNAGGYFNVEQSEQMKIMLQGNTAMAIVWSDLIYYSIKTKEGFNTKYGFAPVPGDKSVLAGGAFFINKKSKEPQEAMKYIVDVMQPKMQIELAKRGLCSSLKTVYDDPEVKKIPYSDALKKSLERGSYTYEAGPDATMISEKITTYIQKMWNNELTPKEALDHMQLEIEKERKVIFSKLK